MIQILSNFIQAMLRTTSTKLTLKADDLKEYEQIRKNWEDFKLPEVKELEVKETEKVRHKTNVRERIGLE